MTNCLEDTPGGIIEVSAKNFKQYIDDYYLYWQRLIPNTVISKVFAPIWGEVKDVWTRDIFESVFSNHQTSLDKPEDFINHSLYFEAKTFIPTDIIEAEKQGFSSPDASWFKGESIDFITSTLMSPSVKIYEYLERGVTIELINNHLKGKKNLRLLIWSLIYFERMINVL